MKFLRKLLRSSAATVVFAALLFISAGRLDFWQAWLYAAISFVMNAATLFALSKNGDLLEERSKPGAGTQTWDKLILGFGLLLTLATLVVAGLDTGRYHWSPSFPWA